MLDEQIAFKTIMLIQNFTITFLNSERPLVCTWIYKVLNLDEEEKKSTVNDTINDYINMKFKEDFQFQNRIYYNEKNI